MTPTRKPAPGAGSEPEHENQYTICTWASETFGPATPMGIAARANQEMAELLRHLSKHPTDIPAQAAEEAADIIIVLMRLFSAVGADAQKSIDRKMAINRQRQWRLDADGHGYHIRATQS